MIKIFLCCFLVFPLFGETFRTFDEATAQFYRQNHEKQTVEFVLAKKEQYLPLRRCKMGIWEAMAYLDTLVDESDPDLHLPQSYHAYQTAEAMRKDGLPRWLILTGFIHDLGKVLTLFGEEQWAVVGDTFPVGCAFSSQIVFPEFFQTNPDAHHEIYGTQLGLYSEGCGLEHVHFSWGHDEYLYQVVKDYLPKEAGCIIRYHSCYPIHREGAYTYLLNEEDHKMLEWVKLFNHYDLYSKSEVTMDVSELEPYYKELVAEFFPASIQW